MANCRNGEATGWQDVMCEVMRRGGHSDRLAVGGHHQIRPSDKRAVVVPDSLLRQITSSCAASPVRRLQHTHDDRSGLGSVRQLQRLDAGTDFAVLDAQVVIVVQRAEEIEQNEPLRTQASRSQPARTRMNPRRSALARRHRPARLTRPSAGGRRPEKNLKNRKRPEPRA